MPRRRKDNGNEVEARIGDNSHLTESESFRLGGYVKEIERHEAERAAIAEQIKEIYADAKERRFNTKAIRHVIKLRRQDKLERDTFAVVVDAYMHALGDFASTELGAAMAPKPPVDTSDRPFGAP